MTDDGKQGFKHGFVATLDGVELRGAGDDDERLLHADGTPLEDARYDDVVYVNAAELERRRGLTSTGWWRELDALSPSPLEPSSASDSGASAGGLSDVDVTSLLLTLAEAHRPAEPSAHVDAGFFHRTLRRWMGLAPDDDPAAARAPAWDYGFWKAELVCEGALEGHAAALSGDAAPSRVTTWCAIVWRGEGDAEGPERYRYWVAVDDMGFVKGSGWLTKAPDLLGDGEGDVDTSAFASAEVEAALLERLLSDPDL